MSEEESVNYTYPQDQGLLEVALPSLGLLNVQVGLRTVLLASIIAASFNAPFYIFKKENIPPNPNQGTAELPSHKENPDTI